MLPNRGNKWSWFSIYPQIYFLVPILFYWFVQSSGIFNRLDLCSQLHFTRVCRAWRALTFKIHDWQQVEVTEYNHILETAFLQSGVWSHLSTLILSCDCLSALTELTKQLKTVTKLVTLPSPSKNFPLEADDCEALDKITRFVTNHPNISWLEIHIECDSINRWLSQMQKSKRYFPSWCLRLTF